MDAPKQPAENPVSTPGTTQNIARSQFFCNSAGDSRKSHYSQVHINSHTPIRHTPKKFHANLRYISPAPKYGAPRLLPLISKFEALDAESLNFSIRDAQPPHLRLPRSRMGRQNIGDMKATREKLLSLFERPGWGAKTLRGLRSVDDRDRSRNFNDIFYESGRGPTKTSNYEAANQSLSPSDKNDKNSWLLSPRPTGRRESRIQDRIKFFDGTAAQSPSKPSSTALATKTYRYQTSPPKQVTGIRTPTKPYGDLRTKETMPSPWMPRKTKEDDRQSYSPDTIEMRGRPRERFHHIFVTPPPSNVAVAARRVQIIHQDPKRNISEEINILYAARSGEVQPEKFQCGVQKKVPSGSECSDAQALPNHSVAAKQGLVVENAVRANSTLGTTLAKSFECVSPAKESKIRDRINYFSNNGGSLQVLAPPIGRIRNHSSPTKLLSQTLRLTPNETPNKATEPGRTCEEPAPKRLPQLALLITPDKVVPNVAPESTIDQQSYTQTNGPKTQSPGLAKWSRINDRIKHFEAFTSGQQASTEIIAVNDSRRWPSPQSKRIRTWPIPAVEKVVKHKTEATVALLIFIQNDEREQDIVQIDSLSISNGIGSKMGKETTRDRDKVRDRQKIYSRQERLRRRSRSRSRSVARTSSVINEEKRAREASEHLKERFGIGAKAAIPTDHEQRPGDEIVQEIWIGGSEDGPSEAALVVDTVVAQCNLAEPRPIRLAETQRMIKLCRGRFGELDRKSGTWRRRMGRDSEKGGGLAL